ncbi:MAG: PP0621 family protein [Moraxellaceae bacterium]
MGLMFRLALLALIVWMVLRFLQRSLGLQISLTRQGENSGTSPTDGQTMRRCSWCKVHVPEGESTRSNEHFFCCEAHRDAFLNRKR